MPPEDAHRRPIVLVLGPTAGGKTSLSIELARRLPGAACLGRFHADLPGMDIGTAKPTPMNGPPPPTSCLIGGSRGGSPSPIGWKLPEATPPLDTRTVAHCGGTNLYVQTLEWTPPRQ